MNPAPFTMAVCGRVSAGKTSLVNALVGYPVGPTSILKETLSPVTYVLQEDGVIDVSHLQKMHENNRAGIPADSQVITVPSRYGMPVTIVDLPGSFPVTSLLKKTEPLVTPDSTSIPQADLLVCAIPAESAPAEVELVRELAVLMEGCITKLVVVITKFDDEEDADLNFLAEEAKKKIGPVPVFRFSSHVYLTHMLSTYKIKLALPDCMRQETKKALMASGVSGREATRIATSEVSDFSTLDVNRDGDWDGFVSHVNGTATRRRTHTISAVFAYIESKLPEHVWCGGTRVVDGDTVRTIPYSLDFEDSTGGKLAATLGGFLEVIKRYDIRVDEEGVIEHIYRLAEKCPLALAHWFVLGIFPPEKVVAYDPDRLIDRFIKVDDGRESSYSAIVISHHPDVTKVGRCKEILGWCMEDTTSKYIIDLDGENFMRRVSMVEARQCLLGHHPTARHLCQLAEKTYEQLVKLDLLGKIRWEEIEAYDHGIWLNLKFRLRDKTFFSDYSDTLMDEIFWTMKDEELD